MSLKELHISGLSLEVLFLECIFENGASKCAYVDIVKGKYLRERENLVQGYLGHRHRHRRRRRRWLDGKQIKMLPHTRSYLLAASQPSSLSLFRPFLVSLWYSSHTSLSSCLSFFHCSLFLKLSFCLCVYPQLIQLQSYTSQRTLYCTMTSELLYNWDLKLSLVWTFIALRFFYFRMTLWYSIHQSLSLSTSLF